MSRDWDAETYHRVSDVHVEWARAVLDRLDLRGNESVLDAGCGSGRTTLMLLERLPRGRVLAVDQAPSMVEHAREALGAHPNAKVIQAELTDLEVDEPVDAVFSNAVFHWVLDHERLFSRLHAALEPGGRLVAQCGGEGNVQGFLEAATAAAREPPYAEHLAGWTGPWNFAGPDETAARLERAGFRDARAWLEKWPVVADHPADYLRTVCLGHHLEQLPVELRDGYVQDVLDRAGECLDYVRLNVEARA